MLIAAGTGVQLGTEAGRTQLQSLLHNAPVSHSSVQRAVSALGKRGLIERALLSTKAVYALTDPVFEIWLKRNGARLVRDAPPVPRIRQSRA